MASKVAVFAVLLLPMLTATSVAVHQGSMVSNSPGEWCWPGMGHPVYPFPRCRALVKSQCVGGQVVESVQKDCCRQIAAISDEWCICAALGSMRGSMYKEFGVALAEGKATVAEVFPGCRTEVMDRAVASLPGICNLDVPNGGGVCYWLRYYQPPRQMSGTTTIW